MNNETDNNIAAPDLIGVDPLAWMSESEKQELANTDNTQAQDSNQQSIELMSVLTIRESEELMSLLKNTSQASHVVIDASQVEKLDAAAVQIIASYYKTASQEGATIQWKEPSSVLLDAFQILGLSEAIGIN